MLIHDDKAAVAWGQFYEGKIRAATSNRKHAYEFLEGDEPRDGSKIDYAKIVPLFTGDAAATMHLAITQAVALMNMIPSRDIEFHQAHTILRQALMDYNGPDYNPDK